MDFSICDNMVGFPKYSHILYQCKGPSGIIGYGKHQNNRIASQV